MEWQRNVIRSEYVDEKKSIQTEKRYKVKGEVQLSKLVMIFASMSGNTEEMADHIAGVIRETEMKLKLLILWIHQKLLYWNSMMELF